MMDVTFTQLTEWLGILWWPFVRFSGFFLVAPVFGDSKVPLMTKVLLALCFSLLCAGMVTNVPSFNPFSLQAVLFGLYQFSFGLIFGLAVQMFITIFTLAGQALSMQMGLSMAMMNDPNSGSSVAITGQIFSLTAMLLFLSMDGHLIVLDVFVDSFTLWPMNQPYPFESIRHLISLFSWMFSSALIISIPAIITMLLSNVTFGFMSRIAPSLNVFVLGFPMTMFLGLFALLISIYGIGDIFFNLLTELHEHLNIMLRMS